jgi:hypothetical protein
LGDAAIGQRPVHKTASFETNIHRAAYSLAASAKWKRKENKKEERGQQTALAVHQNKVNEIDRLFRNRSIAGPMAGWPLDVPGFFFFQREMSLVVTE